MLAYSKLNLDAADPTWHPLLQKALSHMSECYLQELTETDDWLPGREKIFNAFSLPINETRFVLFGESPYPRKDSANGYAFWDNRVTQLWSETGLNKAVNRATSLRNLIKMLLVAAKRLEPGKTSQLEIAQLDKSDLIQTNAELFSAFIDKGFLLLNATPILRLKQVRQDALAWHPFVQQILFHLQKRQPLIQLILLGKIANTITKLINLSSVNTLCAEHPYNISFIHNQEVLNFFKPLKLLEASARA